LRYTLVTEGSTELYQCLKLASGLSGRRLKRFHASQQIRRISGFIDDFSPLRELSAFTALEQDIKQIIETQGWLNQNAYNT
ncbi:MAG: hypothetical protein ACE5FD_11580, partial [Anaerolineae bacterium]